MRRNGKVSRRGLAACVVAVLVVGTVLAVGPPSEAAPLAATGRKGRSDNGKLTPRLAALHRAAHGGAAARAGVADNRPGGLKRLANGRAVVDVHVDDVGAATQGRLAAVGEVLAVSDPAFQTITVSVADGDLQELGAVEGVRNVQEVLAPITRAACTPLISEGDAQLKAGQARSAFGVDGTGVTVGILSDSFNHPPVGSATTMASDVAAGDLPGTGNPCGRPNPVNLVDDSATPPNIDEGRAMAQTVHDLAPGANIAFATADISETSFANNITALANAGAKVIVDDVGYFNEPFYQDGPISIAANAAKAAGVSYFTAAGNSNMVVGGRDVGSYEATSYRGTACPALPDPYLDCQSFSPTGSDPTSGMVVGAGDTLVLDLQWAQPRGGVVTDYDICILDAATGGPLDCGNSFNVSGPGATQQAFEVTGYTNGTGAAKAVNVVVGRFQGPPARFKWIHVGGDPPLSVERSVAGPGEVYGPTVTGHTATSGALSVGAVPFDNASVAEDYSSKGPAVNLFSPVPSTAPLASPEVQAKPDFMATDCVQNSFFPSAGPPHRFCGTSDAAPHAAAVAALMLSANPGASPDQVGAALRATAAPVGALPASSVGAGLVDANAATASIKAGPVAGATFAPLSPARIWDSRGGAGPAGVIGAGQTRSVTVTGVGGVPPTGVTAVVLNVTAVNPTAATFVTAWPAGETKPLASNLNVPAGDVRPNLVVVKVGAGGQVSFNNAAGSVNLIADVAGYYGAAGGQRYRPLSPSRLWDSRFGPGPVGQIGAGQNRTVTVTGVGGVPASGVTAVVLNVTAVSPTAATYVTAWPAGEPQPLASNLNVPPGDVRPNLVVVKVGAGGQVSLNNAAGSLNLIADVAGYYGATGSSFTSVSPKRVWDSRGGAGPFGQVGAGQTRSVTVTGVGGGVPPTGVTAVVLNVTAVSPSAATFVTAWPAGESRPLASNLNVPAGDVRPNLVVVKVGASGQVSFNNAAGNVHLIADIAGYFGPAGL